MAKKPKKTSKNSKFFKLAFGGLFFICIFCFILVFYFFSDAAASNPAADIQNSKQVTKIDEKQNSQKNQQKNTTKSSDLFYELFENTDKSNQNEQKFSAKSSEKNHKNDEKNIAKTSEKNHNNEKNTAKTSEFFSSKSSEKNESSCKNGVINCTASKEKSVFDKKSPLLAIIIDDVGTLTQAKMVKNLIDSGKIVTPSIFPPNQNYPHTVKIANMFKFYGIHLPLEAKNFKRAEKNTLKTTSSKQEIAHAIDKISQNFPKALFINNHTGSTFCENETSMRWLLSEIYRNNFVFIDSKTTSHSKAKKITQELNEHYFFRDVFLDNSSDKIYIKNQLELAKKTAQKKGYAIAIAHPRKHSIESILEFDFKGVKLVYIDDILRQYR